jgi:hypothetical protein
MIKKRLILKIFLTLVISGISVLQVFAADLELTERKQIKLDVSPLDIAASADGQWLFILTPGEIIVYSAFENKISKGIPIDKGFDRLTYSARDNALILSSRTEKSVKIIQMELIHQFDNSGLPVEGPENAPVTVAVFGDYQ